jgi:outer membrane protein assembly factor BamB
MAPAFVPGSDSTPSGRDIVVLGQKNGNLYALFAEQGNIAWSVSTSPDGTEGGLSWGIAADDANVYFTAINYNAHTFQLQPSNVSINNSAYGAVSLVDGSFLWETQAPHQAIAFNPPTVVNDIVISGYTGVDDGSGNFDQTTGALVALKKATGEIILDVTLDANFHGGIAVQDSHLFFGTGYWGIDTYNGNGSFWAVDLDSRRG